MSHVIIPAALFTVLSPGLILQLPSTKIGTMKTSNMSVGIHALVFMAVYWLIAKALGLTMTKADLIVPAVLFLILSPHGSTTDLNAVLIRALIFAVIFATLRRVFPQVY
jgi:hypothetical protein